MAQELQIWLHCVSKMNVNSAPKYGPAFRFRYTEENVASDPMRTAMYAKGTESESQSISNMMAELRTQGSAE